MDKIKKQLRHCTAVLIAMAILFNGIWADGAVLPALEKPSADSGKHNIEKPGICHIARGGVWQKCTKG